MQHTYRRLWRMICISRQNEAGALDKPKGILVNWYSPRLVQNADLSHARCVMPSCHYPGNKSIVAKYLEDCLEHLSRPAQGRHPWLSRNSSGGSRRSIGSCRPFSWPYTPEMTKASSKSRSRMSWASHLEYFLLPAERRDVDDVEVIGSVRRHRCRCVMLQNAAIPQIIHRTCSKCVAVTAHECGKAALVRRSKITLGDWLIEQILKMRRNGEICWLHREYVGRSHTCLQQCVVSLYHWNTKDCRRPPDIHTWVNSTRRRKTVCSGAEDRSIGAQHGTRNGHSKTNWR